MAVERVNVCKLLVGSQRRRRDSSQARRRRAVQASTPCLAQMEAYELNLCVASAVPVRKLSDAVPEGFMGKTSVFLAWTLKY